MSRYTIAQFVAATAQKDEARGTFELENPYTLEVNLDGRVWCKAGAMIGYVGGIRFTRQGLMEQGLGNMLKSMVSSEGVTLMKMEGTGRVYLADAGKRVQILELGAGEQIYVNGNDLLALEDGMKYEIKMMRRVAGMASGGLFNVRVTGPGVLAMTTHYNPITLRVTAAEPVFTDPNATVAWSGSLSPEIHTDISFKTLLGRGSGETFQLRFQGEGWVVLQPYEEVYMQRTR
ncbi:MAG TPA: AIM24 family protein [Longimicrobium sp.]|uniref:AIM24 family protein n=1 Tax=Longimicrobium sp. TaxID=2029185 RepID=UPI002EDB97D5